MNPKYTISDAEKERLEKEIRDLNAIYGELMEGTVLDSKGLKESEKQEELRNKINDLMVKLHLPNVISLDEAIELAQSHPFINEDRRKKCLDSMVLWKKLEEFLGWDKIKHNICNCLTGAISYSEYGGEWERHYNRIASYSPGNRTVIQHKDWNDLVVKTYGNRYNIQQQYGCLSKGEYIEVSVPKKDDTPNDWYKKGIELEEWCNTKEELTSYDEYSWEREFYPAPQVVADDLYKRGLLKEGEYTIIINY